LVSFQTVLPAHQHRKPWRQFDWRISGTEQLRTKADPPIN
jgi:hypothetical protein